MVKIKEAIVVEARNAIGAQVGDLVKIEAESGPVLKAAVVMYMVPMILFFVGYAIGAIWGLGALFGGLFFALSIALVVVYDRKVVRKHETLYTITKFAAR